jgi:hypothetical protein
MKRIGSTPTLVLCSWNARPEKGLVRQAHLDQHGYPSKAERASKLGRIIEKHEERSMRAVEDNLTVPVGGCSKSFGEGKVGEEKGK